MATPLSTCTEPTQERRLVYLLVFSHFVRSPCPAGASGRTHQQANPLKARCELVATRITLAEHSRQPTALARPACNCSPISPSISSPDRQAPSGAVLHMLRRSASASQHCCSGHDRLLGLGGCLGGLDAGDRLGVVLGAEHRTARNQRIGAGLNHLRNSKMTINKPVINLSIPGADARTWI